MRYAAIAIVLCILVSCNRNNVTTDESLEKHFEAHKVSGTFGLYNNATNGFTIYNLARFRDSAYLPASTFKIVNSLIGLETGRIADDKMVIPWDGIERPVAAWNKDLTMAEAFKASAVPYYQEVARRIGKDTMQRWLDTLGYAAKYNKAVVGKIDTFWLDNSMKITADEQLGLMKRLYFDQLPFQKRTTRIVKQVMVMEKTAGYTLAYKTGLGTIENGNKLGWIVGWIEENRHPYFFAMNIEGDAQAELAPLRIKILKSILSELDFMKGIK